MKTSPIFIRSRMAQMTTLALLSMAGGVQAAAVSALPEGTTDAIIHIQGPGTDAGKWSGTVNGSALDNTGKLTTIYANKGTDKTIQNIEVNLNNLSNGYAGSLVGLSGITQDISLRVNVQNSTFTGMSVGFNSQSMGTGVLTVSNNFNSITFSGDKATLYAVYDMTRGKRHYRTIENNFTSVQGGSGLSTIYGASFINGDLVIDHFENNASDIKDATQLLHFVSNNADVTLGSAVLNTTNVELSSALFNVYFGATDATKQFTLKDSLSVNLDNVSLQQSFALNSKSSNIVLDGNLYLNAKNVDVIDRGSSAILSGLVLRATVGDKDAEIRGDVLVHVENSATDYSISSAYIRQLPNNVGVNVTNAHIGLRVFNVETPRLRTMTIMSMTNGNEPDVYMKDSLVSLRIQGYSSLGSRTEDNPVAISYNASYLKLDNTDVMVTLHADEKNAFNDQSLYGMTLGSANSKLDMTGDIIVTLDGEAKNLGFGRYYEGKEGKAIGGIYAIGVHKDSTLRNVHLQGERILQFGSARTPFISTKENPLIAPFAGFTKVVVAENSSLVIGDSQGKEFVTDDQSTSIAMYDKGLFSKAGEIAVVGTEEKVGLELHNGSLVSANKVSFSNDSFVQVQGTAQLESKETTTINENANVTVVSSSDDAVLQIRGGYTNSGSLGLDHATVSFDAGKDHSMNLGAIRTIGTRGSSVMLGGGSYTIDSFRGARKNLVLDNLQDTKKVTVSANTGDLGVVISGHSNDQYASSQEAANALVQGNVVSIAGATNTRVRVDEGIVNNSASFTVDASGNMVDYVEEKNHYVDAAGAMMGVAAMQWRHDLMDLSQRMGEVRMMPSKLGSWVRLYGSDQEYTHQNIDTKWTTVQVGADYQVTPQWTVGAAFTYTNGSSDYQYGQADTDAYTFGMYGTWLADNGQYLDLSAKYTRLNNDFRIDQVNHRLDNNAWGVSAEYGWNFRIHDVAFIEPQVGLAYGRIAGDDYTASNGVKFEQDDYDSLVGRVGMRAGFVFPEQKGSLYARVGVLHDFQGDIQAKASHQVSTNTITEELDDTWLEFGVGAHFSMTPTTYVYTSLDRTTSGDVDTNWRYNVGVRHAW